MLMQIKLLVWGISMKLLNCVLAGLMVSYGAVAQSPDAAGNAGTQRGIS